MAETAKNVIHVMTLMGVVFLTVLVGYGQPAIRQSIIPLMTEKGDVAKIAKYAKTSGSALWYETETELLQIYYTDQRCVGHGWNVSPNTVLRYNVYPRVPITLNEMGLKDDYVETSDDSSRRYLTNRASGTIVVMLPQTDRIESISYMATSADARLRCRGFPPFDPVRSTYSPYRRIPGKRFADLDLNGLDAFFGLIHLSQDWRYTILIYCSNGRNRDCLQAQEKINNVVARVRGLASNPVSIRLGGYREHLEIECFALPQDYPEVVATPEFDSTDLLSP